ncbi:MAG: chemotaxis protein CheA, partial [Gammaproteobacteria bacterium]
ADEESAGEAAATEPAEAASAEDSGDITDAEFEALLEAMPEKESGTDTETAGAGGSEEITEDEFEALLDQLHGKGQFKPEAVKPKEPPASGKAGEGEGEASAGGEEITEEEFEALLDQLHGKGQFKPEAVKPKEPPKSEPAAAAQPSKTAGDKPAPKKPAGSKPAGKAAAARAEKGATAPHKPPAETTVRVDTRRLDDIMNLVGELVLVRNRLATLRASMHDEQISKAIGNLDLVTSDLQDAVMKTRMQPVKKVFGRFPRVVRDLSRSLNKEVRLELRGEDTDLDKNLVEALADPLVHLVRNAVDHGIEPPDEREKAGKPREGHVILAAAQEGDHILLTIQDDGKGMDPDVLRAKAVEKGLMDEEAARRLSDKDAYNLIFMPGFSTKTEISDVSGRGVGMDVVKTSITQLNGTVEIDSELGKGSVISIKVPLTLAIMPTLMIIVGGQRFAVPLTSVNEIFDLDLSRTNTVDDQEVVIVREKALPLFYLRHWLVRGADRNERIEQGHVVVATVGTQQVGLVVDGLVGQEEVVIKPLGAGLRGLPGFSGATITGDGGIALILDLPSLIKAHA